MPELRTSLLEKQHDVNITVSTKSNGVYRASPVPSSEGHKEGSSWTCPCTGRAAGFAFATLAVLAVSPDAMLLRFVRMHAPRQLMGQDWSQIAVIIAIKYAMMGCIQMCHALCMTGSSLLHKVRKSWRVLVTPSAFMLITQIGFTIGLLETTAANAIVYFSLNPLWAALMGLAFLGDRVQRHTVIAMAIAFTAVGVAFIPSMLAGPEADEPSGKHGVPSEGASSPTLHGDLIAFATGMTLAGFITSSRASSLGDNEAPMSVAPALGSLGASLLATPFAIHACLQRGGSSSSGGGGAVSLSPSFLLFLLADATLEACYDVWMGEAAEFITSAEVAIVLLLEIPLGPLYVFVTFGETPPLYTVVGASVLLVTLVGHGAIEAMYTRRTGSKRASRRPSREASPVSLTFANAAVDDGGVAESSVASLASVRRTYSWSEDLSLSRSLSWSEGLSYSPPRVRPQSGQSGKEALPSTEEEGNRE